MIYHDLARAVVWRLALPPLARLVLRVLVNASDKDGRSWLTPKELAAQLPESETASEAQVLTALRQLHEEGFITPERIAPHEPGELGQKLPHGGRLFKVNFEAILGATDVKR